MSNFVTHILSWEVGCEVSNFANALWHSFSRVCKMSISQIQTGTLNSHFFLTLTTRKSEKYFLDTLRLSISCQFEAKREGNWRWGVQNICLTQSGSWWGRYKHSQTHQPSRALRLPTLNLLCQLFKESSSRTEQEIGSFSCKTIKTDFFERTVEHWRECQWIDKV